MQMYENYSVDEKDTSGTSSSANEDEPKTERNREPNKKAQPLIKIKSDKKGFEFSFKWIFQI
jgi:hypothetical protein